jgi:hypothetical protein
LNRSVRLVGLLLILLAAGCRSTHVVPVDSTGAPQYAQLNLVYAVQQRPVDAAAAGWPADSGYVKTHPIKASIASFAGRRSAAREAVTTLRYRIVFPHPDGRTDVGLATLEAADAAGTSEGNVFRTVATTEIPRSELDLLLINLANGGVFDTAERRDGSVVLDIGLDDHRISRQWTREPRLDRLAAATYDAR